MTETTNDIMRKLAVEMMNISMQDITAERIHGWATRLGEVVVAKTETTTPTCKESLQVGNAAKMREALEQIIDHIDSLVIKDDVKYTIYQSIVEMAKRALSTPARNCDLYLTPKDAMLAHLDDVYEGEKVEFGDYEWCEFVKWLLAEAKGDAK